MLAIKRKNKDKLFKNIKICLRLLNLIMAVALLSWFIFSYVEVISQNLDMVNPTVLSKWNFFEWVTKGYIK